jgi:hypothetical protein
MSGNYISVCWKFPDSVYLKHIIIESVNIKQPIMLNFGGNNNNNTLVIN